MPSFSSDFMTPKNLLRSCIMVAMYGQGVQAFAAVNTLETISLTAEAERQAFRGNMDAVRTEDDAQALQVIDREEIAKSGATTIDELLQKSLSMNAGVANDSASGWTGNTSQINLRGLGASHTLVLINGRRGAGVGGRGVSESTDQQNLKGIPLAAIERIEVLPSSAAALYGSNALGGVINVVLRRDYVGTEANLRYDNTFKSDTGMTTLNLTTGFALEQGRTQVMLTAQKQDSNQLKAQDRNFKLKERQIELANNPSAIYGVNNGVAVNPPMGHLTNIRTKDGSELFDGAGSSYAYVPKGYTGAAEGIEAFKNTAGQYALGLASGIGGDSGAATLIGEQDNESYSLNINRDFTDKLNVYLEGAYERQHVASAGNYHGFGTVTLTADNPQNPFGKDILITYSPDYSNGLSLRNREMDATMQRMATGFEYRISDDWRMIGDYAWSNTDKSIRYQRRPTKGTNKFNADVASGKIDFLKDVTTYDIDLNQGYWGVAQNDTDQTLQEWNLRAHGPIAKWYAGDISLATGVGYTDWKSSSRSETQSLNNPDLPFTKKAIDSQSLYAEFNIPFISAEQNLSWLKLLDLQLAARYETYNIKNSGEFSQTSPTLGLRLAPNDSVMLRGSYSKGFIVPTAAQLAEETLATSESTVTDPLNQNQQVVLFTTGGGNPDLTPETATSFGAGVVLTPQALPGFRWTIDYFNIEKDNNITSLGAQAILDANAKDGSYANRVIRDAEGNLQTVNTTPFNALWLKTSGIDTQMSYQMNTRMGELNLNVGYTWTEKYDQQEQLGKAASSYLNDPNNDSAGPLKHRLNASAFLQATQAWGLGWAMQYYGKYDLKNETAILLQGKDTVDAQTYHDVYARYSSNLAKYGSPELSFGIKNVFGESQKDMTNTYLSKFSDPRLQQYYLNLKFAF